MNLLFSYHVYKRGFKKSTDWIQFSHLSNPVAEPCGCPLQRVFHPMKFQRGVFSILHIHTCAYFLEPLRCCYIYFHCSYLYNYDSYSRTLCIKCLSFSISYWDLIKIPYFADTLKRGDRAWKQAQRQGDFTDNSIVTVVSLERGRVVVNNWQSRWSLGKQCTRLPDPDRESWLSLSTERKIEDRKRVSAVIDSE
jgi:hypothetical protein